MVAIQSLFSTAYNTAPSQYNYINQVAGMARVASLVYSGTTITQASVPVVYNAGVPYITWNAGFSINNMAAAVAGYWATFKLYLLGFYV